MIEQFEKLLAQGRDDALLRFSLGNAYLKQGDSDKAAQHLRAALAHNPQYSAAWRSLGQALATADPDAAVEAYEQGILVAEQQGDKQAAKEMRVFARRLQASR